MQVRAFNKILIDKQKGILVKTSINKKKLEDEINYYLNIPEAISDFFPKLLNYSNDYSSYSLEYLPYNSLSELILNNQISKEESLAIIDQLFSILADIHQVLPNITITKEEICNFYIQKTFMRLKELAKDDFFKALFALPTIKINGKTYKNFQLIEENFISLFNKFVKKDSQSTVIHGDFCFSNILYSKAEKKIKLIDPRGSFSRKGIYGHTLYDFAKLMHCLNSKYDFIVNDQFTLKEFPNNHFYYYLPDSQILKELEELYVNKLLEKNYFLEFIYLIEASLFLSMACLHYENKNRQKIFFFRGIVLLNTLIEGKYAHMY